MEYQDYYAILGVPRTATEQEIRSAYRRLARQYHPDVNPGNKEAEERFKRINEAYEVLSDPEKRKRYDELGAHWQEYEQWQQAARERGAAGYSGATGPGGFRYEYRRVNPEDLRDLFGTESPFSEFFHAFFGGRPGSSVADGVDLETEIEVSLAEAYRGARRTLTVRLPNGEQRRVEVTIPAGVDSGTRLRIPGQGAPARGGGRPGDLYVTIVVHPDPRFERRGDDLYLRLSVPFTTLALGGEARVRTPDDRTLALTIPAGTQDGQVFRLRGQGMPRAGQPTQRGDLHVEVHARLPTRLSARQRQLLDEFARLGVEAEAGAGVR